MMIKCIIIYVPNQAKKQFNYIALLTATFQVETAARYLLARKARF